MNPAPPVITWVRARARSTLPGYARQAVPSPPPSVVICALGFGGEAQLETLRRVVGELPDGAELILVRSGGSGPAALSPEIERLLAGTRRARMLVEPLLGVARARARGLAAAASDVVLFVDDDVLPWPGWYRALADAMKSPATGAAGGTIVPRWPGRGSPPRWLDRRLWSQYGQRDAADSGDQYPYGANMAVRRSAAEAVGGFRPELGPVGSTPTIHEETELCARLEAAGYRVVDAPGAMVEHLVGGETLRARWVLRRLWWEGRSDALRDAPEPGAVVARLAKLAGLLAALPVAALAGRRTRLYVAARAAANAGYLAAAIRRLRKPR